MVECWILKLETIMWVWTTSGWYVWCKLIGENTQALCWVYILVYLTTWVGEKRNTESAAVLQTSNAAWISCWHLNENKVKQVKQMKALVLYIGAFSNLKKLRLQEGNLNTVGSYAKSYILGQNVDPTTLMITPYPVLNILHNQNITFNSIYEH